MPYVPTKKVYSILHKRGLMTSNCYKAHAFDMKFPQLEENS